MALTWYTSQDGISREGTKKPKTKIQAQQSSAAQMPISGDICLRKEDSSSSSGSGSSGISSIPPRPQSSSYNHLANIHQHRLPRLCVRPLGLARHPHVQRTVQVPTLQRPGRRSDPRLVEARPAPLPQLLPAREDADDENRMPAQPARFAQEARDGAVEPLAGAELAEVARGLLEVEHGTDVQVAGEDVFAEKNLGGVFAAVEVHGAHDGADEARAGVFDRRCGDVAASPTFVVVAGEEIAEFVVVDGHAAHASSPRSLRVRTVGAADDLRLPLRDRGSGVVVGIRGALLHEH